MQSNSGELANLYEHSGYKTFERTGDIYCLFYERGNNLLKNNGHLCYITSNKWMRAGYGKHTRDYFAMQTNPKLLIDFGGSKIFESATVDTNILLFQKAENLKSTLAVTIKTKKLNAFNIKSFVTENAIISSFDNNDVWNILTKQEQQVMSKIELAGIPLGEWNIQIRRGIVTGLNKAFIIDNKTKDELLAKDPKNSEIIKPLYRGRDIKKYQAQFKDLWLINSHNGVRNKYERIYVKKDYPYIYEHLEKYEPQLRRRVDKGYHWTNLRNCSYLDEFEKEKIAYNDISRKKLTFARVESSAYFNNTVYFLNNSSPYLLAILNSRLIDWYYRNISAQLGENTVRMFSIYVEKIPIPIVSKGKQMPLLNLAKDILQRKAKGHATKHLEDLIDLFVYKLYQLEYNEVKLIDPKFPLTEEKYKDF